MHFFPIQVNYYVVDVEYPNMTGFLAPYKGLRYHRSDFQNGRQPREGKEMFNYRHSSLRNIIKRCFGVWKARWPILKQMAPFPFETQRLIVVASMAIHNFIRENAIADQEFRPCEQDEDYVNNDEDITVTPDPVTNNMLNPSQQREMNIVRDGICNAIIQHHRNSSST